MKTVLKSKENRVMNASAYIHSFGLDVPESTLSKMKARFSIQL